jgi:hypothetical protein
VDLWLGERLHYISGGDEGRWQPYVALTSIAWGSFVGALVLGPALRTWGRGRGLVSAAAAAVAAASIAVVALIATLFAILVVGGD